MALRWSAIAALAAAVSAGPFAAGRLRTEYLENPRVIDAPQPRFFWVVSHTDRGQSQSAYRIVVNATLAGTTVWDSGVVASSATSQIVYSGSALSSDTTYQWAVQWTDASGQVSDWSAPATFATGLFSQSEWSSDWVTCPQDTNRNQLRTEFSLGLGNGVTVTQARLYITGLGYYRAFVNGQRLGQNELDPGWTTYPQRVLYNAYDVTTLLNAQGANAFAVYIGNGWPNIAPNPFNGSSNAMVGVSQEWQDAGDATGTTLHPLAEARLTGAQAAAANRLRDNTGAVRKLRAQLHVHGSDGSVTVFTTNAGSFVSQEAEAIHAAHKAFANAKRVGKKGKKAVATTSNLRIVQPSWSCAAGALIDDDVYNGCTWDSRLETLGWDMPGYNGGGISWVPAVLAADPGGVHGPTVMTAQAMPEVTIMEELQPRSINQPSPGVYVLDFDQNFSGYVRLTLPAPVPANITITLRHAEVLQHPPYGPQDGNIYVGNLRSAKATDIYTTRTVSDGSLVLQPLFTYHGFRYVEISGLPYAPTEAMVTGLFFRSAVEQTGSLSFPAATANVLNQLHHAVQWGTGANLMSVQSDCPQRDERKGWMGDSGLSQEQTSLNYDMCAFWTMWALNMQDAQTAVQYTHPAGALPDTVPWTFGSDPGDPAWQTAFNSLVYTLWTHCGDTRAAAALYSNMADLLNFEASRVNATGVGKMYSYYGDWCPPPAVPGNGQGPKPPGSLVSSAAFLGDIARAIELATALGHAGDAATWTSLLSYYTSQYNAAFFNSASASYGNSNGDGLQSANAASLHLGLVPAGDVAAVATALANDVVTGHANHWSTGIFGMKYLHRALTENGFGEAAIDNLLVEGYPGFQFWFNNDLEPATTMLELPDMYAEGPGMNSRNHHMFASVGAYLYDLVGIRLAPGTTGWSKALLYPAVSTHPNVSYASGSKMSLAGQYALSWQRASGEQCISNAPENSIQTLTCPGSESSLITNITFADFGLSTGSCGNFQHNPQCTFANTSAIVSSLCVGRHSCNINVTDTIFSDPCYGTVKHFSASATCSGQAVTFIMSATVPTNGAATVVLPVAGGAAINATVTETVSNGVIFAGSAYKPGVAGVTGASIMAGNVGIAVEVASGSFSFQLAI